uniref:Uncharacterized protein n=1 Tax=Cacopsylla melanoneura TaxID=428564 RepID=A0A8D9B527_9HEMI
MSSPPQCFDSFLGLSLQTGMIMHCIIGNIIELVSLLIPMMYKACKNPLTTGIGAGSYIRIIYCVVALIVVSLGERINIQVHGYTFFGWLAATVYFTARDVVFLILLLVNPTFEVHFWILLDFIGAAACHSMYIVQFVLLLMSVVIFCSGTFVYWSYYKDMGGE